MSFKPLRSVGLAALVVGMALFGSLAFAGSAAAASNGSISADPVDAGVESTHTVTLTVGSSATGSLNGFAIDYADAGANVSNVGTGDIAVIGIDRGDDNDGTAVDVNVSDDLDSVSASNNGRTLTLGLGGSYSLDEGDEVVVVVEGVTNPDSEGDYGVSLDINPQSSGGEGTATLSVGSDGLLDGGDDSDSSENTTTTTTTTTTTESGSGSDGEAEASANASADAEASGGTPGFGVGAALAALLAAGALLARRD